MDIDPNDPVAMLRIDRKALLAAGKEFENKKWCWIRDPKEGYKAAEVKSTKGDKFMVETNDGKEEEVKKDDTEQMNPPKYEKSEDMANLTYLNEASVIHNLKQRYFGGLIYTYSGLFCVAINPYRRLPIYTEKIVFAYRGKRKNEMPPHIFSICDNAYQNMLQDRENQSMLITGESGAGKTENTKKVIQYLAHVSGGLQTKGEKDHKAQTGGSLEDQVIQTNPILEAYGNAKTLRNNNSSRFGKFIRCHFGPQGKLAGCDIEQYLLEKSRVIFQQDIERNYHIFYQLLKGGDKQLHESLLLDSNKHTDYAFTEKGCEIAEGIDDVEEFNITGEAADTLGFTPEEKITMYKICAACLHWGNAKFKQRPREEQAEVVDPKDLDKVSFLLKLPGADFVKNIIKPRIKVGREFVNQGRNVQQVTYSIGALTKSLYERMFLWLVEKANQTLLTKDRRSFFIGVLDIAGFEIFTFNSFEQLCINVTNEKLQQFFNHHMFVLEQEEYKREGIHWEFIDFGLDLLPTIDLIFSKGTGIFAILEEECIVPKATDQTLLAKLENTHSGKSVKYGKPKISGKKAINYHFEVHHYAGTVGYNIDSWLDKNKDPINEAVANIFAKSGDHFIAHLWKDYATEGHTRKGGSFMTVSAKHKEQLGKLMETLYSTSPHFVRCIIPNEIKKAGVIDTNLVLHQLRCNGVLEGIRICRKGFPNRIPFQEFKQRYQILAPTAISGQFMDGKKACEKLLGAMTLEESEYRIGTTKVFFKAGVLGQLEDWRDERLAKIISMFQAYCKGFLMRKEYRKMCDQRIGISVIQRNVRKYLYLRNWNWWKLYTKVKPLLQVARADDEMKQKIEQMKDIEDRLAKEEALRKELEEKYTKLVEEKNLLFQDFQREQDASADAEERNAALDAKKNDLESQMKEMLEQLEDEEEAASELSGVKQKLESEITELKQDVEELDTALKKAEEDGKQKDKNIEQLNEELQQQDEAIAKVSKAKKAVEEQCQELEDSLQEEQNKVNHLNKVKTKLEQQLDETQSSWDREKKLRADVEKVKRKVEGDLKTTQDTLEEVKGQKEKTEEELKKREIQISSLNTKCEDQSTLIEQLRKKIKQLEARIEELEQELEQERNNRSKSERARQELEQELDDLNERLDEAGGATSAQMDLNKKREQDIVKLRKDLEEQSLANEQTVNSMRAKQNQALVELQEELDTVKKHKGKLEKEKAALQNEGDDLASSVENYQKQKQQLEKNNRAISDQLSEARAQNDDFKKNISELEVIRGRFTSENADLNRQLEDHESKGAQLTKNKKTLEQQIEELKKQLEDEMRAKSDAQNKFKNLEADYDSLQENFEETEDGKADMQKQLSRSNAELQSWKNKFEQEGLVKLEELEDSKRKMVAKLQETEQALEAALIKATSAEKSKNRLNGELEDAIIDLEKAQTTNSALEKKQKKIDQDINEWRNKLDEVQAELDNSQKEARNFSTEMYRLKATAEEQNELMEALKRENKSLAGEVNDLADQLGEGGKSVVELGKLRKRLEMEKDELQTALEEAEGALEVEEGKVLKVQLELTQVRQEFDRRLADRDEEIDNLRKNQQRQLDALQGSLDAEVKAKNDQARLRKKFESDVIELENNCENLMKANQELQKNIKKHQQQVKDLQIIIEEEQRGRDDARDAASRAERRAAEMASELEDLRNQLEQADRARRAADQERSEAVDRAGELTNQVNNLQQAKRKLDGQVNTMQEELDDAENEAKSADDRAKKAASELLRVQGELISAHDAAGAADRARLSAERIQNDLQLKIEELEAAGGKALKNQIKKLEQRVKELERDLDAESRRSNEAQKLAKKNERRMRELQFQEDEEQKNLARALEAVERSNNKNKKMRVAVEEAEQLAASNLARYRKAQAELDEAEERVESLESSLQKARGRGGGRSSGVMRTSSRETSRRGLSSTRSASSASLDD